MIINFERFCRVVDPPGDYEEHEKDRDDIPIYQQDKVWGIPKPGDAVVINPQKGCFGHGPQGLKTKNGIFGLNTASLVTYGRYLILLLFKHVKLLKIKFTI